MKNVVRIIRIELISEVWRTPTLAIVLHPHCARFLLTFVERSFSIWRPDRAIALFRRREWYRVDSNHQRQVLQTCALPLELRHQLLLREDSNPLWCSCKICIVLPIVNYPTIVHFLLIHFTYSANRLRGERRIRTSTLSTLFTKST